MIRILQILALMPVLFVFVACAPNPKRLNATFLQLDPKHDSIIIGRFSDNNFFKLIDSNEKSIISLLSLSCPGGNIFLLRSLALEGYFAIPVTPGKYSLETQITHLDQQRINMSKGTITYKVTTFTVRIPISVEAGKLINLGHVKKVQHGYTCQEDLFVLFHFGNCFPNIYDSYKSNIIDMSFAKSSVAK